MKIKISVHILIFSLAILAGCSKNGSDPQPVDPEMSRPIPIEDLRELSRSQPVKLEQSGLIEGIITSDGANKNIDDAKTFYLQDSTGGRGIKVKLKEPHQFAINDKVRITLSNLMIGTLDAEVTLIDIPNERVNKTGSDKINPLAISYAELLRNKEKYEGSVVRLSTYQVSSDNGKFSGKIRIGNGKHEVKTWLNEGVSFANETLNPGAIDVVGIVRLAGGELRIAPRSTADFVKYQELLEDFSKWLHKDWTFNTARAEEAMYTEVAKWLGDYKDGAIRQVPLAADKAFTVPGKSYPYLPKDSLHSMMLLQYPLENRVKSIEITFAASNATGNLTFKEESVGDYPINQTVLPFTAEVDEAMIAVEIPIPGDKRTNYFRLKTFDQPIKQTGKFHTVTFLVPQHVDELEASASNEASANAWLKNQTFRIINLSSRHTKGITDIGFERFVPIIIDKVVFGY